MSILLRESGGHRWQRIPPTEKRGRVHTSTVTVAVFEVKPPEQWMIKDSEIEIFTTKDSGPGGQHRNKTESCVVMRHKPTGIEAKAAEKSQHQNRRAAREMLEVRVAEFLSNQMKKKLDATRRDMIGSGMRGDKIRTYREQDNVVIDHRTGRKISLSVVEDGHIDALVRRTAEGT